MEKSFNRYSPREEIANSISHGIGLLLAIVALCILIISAGGHGDAWYVFSVSVYGATLILLYTASTLYHSIQKQSLKGFLQNLDHSAIYLLIAGTYTPFTLVNLRGPWGWGLFGVVWGLAVLGIVLQFMPAKQRKTVSLMLYVGMGWSVVAAVKPLIQSVQAGGILFLVLGGLAYTLGIFFYVRDKMNYNHAVWHLFVLAGSIFHFFAVLFYVVPAST
jgi:hemolysin III